MVGVRLIHILTFTRTDVAWIVLDVVVHRNHQLIDREAPVIRG